MHDAPTRVAAATMAATDTQFLVRSTTGCIPEEPEVSSVAPSLTFSDDSSDDADQEELQQQPRRRRASTKLIAQNAGDIQRITGETQREYVTRCCGGGCCLLRSRAEGVEYDHITLPDNDAFRGLNLKVRDIPKTLSNVVDVPEQTVFFETIPQAPAVSSPTDSAISLSSPPIEAADSGFSLCQKVQSLGLDDLDTSIQPPMFVQPHPPYHVFPARIYDTRPLTRPGAEKRTYHFDLDVTDYPGETGVDFKVGGAIGVMAPNEESAVDELLDRLGTPRFLRDRPVKLRTSRGRWPTVWGEDQARELVTTRRNLLAWCSDIQTYPPCKPLLRVLAEYASDEDEKKILTLLCSSEGYGIFCDLRNSGHVSVSQLLHAFPSSQPPLEMLLSVLQPLMPRFYSLSNDPHESFSNQDGQQRRLIEIAVTVHEADDWRKGTRTGVGSGFLERQSLRFTAAKEAGERAPEFYVPMFKGLMANPLAKQFVTDGPMLLIGAGVGIAPFRGFVQRRLKTANCANKVWVLQGIRDSLVDEIYNGEWGVHEEEVKRIVESRRGEGRYVQEEVRNQADLVWQIINTVDGRIFVCGSTKGMGEGVEEALVDVAMQKGNLEREEAKKFLQLKKEAGQYIAETW